MIDTVCSYPYGGSTGRHDQLYKKGDPASYIGSEAEIVLQRGTTYRIKDIQQKGRGGYNVIMEVVDQPDYFKTGYEQTHDGGATSFRH